MAHDTLTRKITERLEADMRSALFGGLPEPRPTALRVRGNFFEVVELREDGTVIEPCRCGPIYHRPDCPHGHIT